MAIGTGEGATVRHDVSGTVLAEWPATVAAVAIAGECVVLRLVGQVDEDHAADAARLVRALPALEAGEVEADLTGHARTLGDGWHVRIEWDDADGHPWAVTGPCRWKGKAWQAQTWGAKHAPQLTLRPHLLACLLDLDVGQLVGLRGRDVRVTLRGAQLTLDEAITETVRVSVTRE